MRRAKLLKLGSLLVPLLVCEASSGQQSLAPLGPGRPIEGSTSGLYLPNSVQSDLSRGVKVHLDVYGKRCVTVAAYSLAKTDFRKIFGGGQTPQAEKDKGASSGAGGQGDYKSKNFEHIVSAQNHCSQTVRLRVCYLGSQDCVPLDVPGYGHQQASLGIAAGTPSFRYQYIEQF